jgi:5'-phosphate synthase pdxT subunit
VKTLARYKEEVVFVQSGKLWASTFHPELSQDTRVHELFVALANE